jgi:hypothetical protein
MRSLTKSQKRLFIVLGIVVAYFAFDVVKNWDSYSGFYGSKHGKAVAPNQTKLANNIVVKNTPRIISYDKNWNKDPFYTPGKTKKVVHRVRRSTQIYLNLKAISFAGQNSVAMINDRILKVGDAISGYRLTKIEPHRVILSGSGGTRVLTLK